MGSREPDLNHLCQHPKRLGYLPETLRAWPTFDACMTSTPEYAKLSRVVQNFFTKSAEIIAQARTLQNDASSDLDGEKESPPINKWFNLELTELDFLHDSLDLWRQATPKELPPPLVLEVYLDPSRLRPGQTVVLAGSRCNTNQEIVLERWIVECKPPTANTVAEDLPLTYKRAIVTMRALFTATHLLPAWHLRQKLKRQRLTEVPLKLGVRVHNGTQPITSRGRVGLSRSITGKPSKLQQFQLHPVITHVGNFHISVSYRVDAAFGVEDIETVMAQKFIELDHPNQSASINQAAGSHGSHTSYVGSQGSIQRPVLSFTRPFRSLEDGGGPGSNIGPQSIAGSASSVVSNSSKFSSSFASQRAPAMQQRSLSQESKAARPLSFHSQLSQTSHASVGSSLAGGPEHDSGGSMAQSDVSDFMKFVDDTRRRTERMGSNSADVDTTLARFQGMRASYGQLSSSFMQDSMAHSMHDLANTSDTSRRTSNSNSGTGTETTINAGTSSGTGTGGTQQTIRAERRRGSGLRSRLGFYSESVDDDAGDGDSDLLFALSDMQM